MNEIRCSNTVCDNSYPISKDPMQQWCDKCYPIRVHKKYQQERGVKEEQEFFNKHWKIAK